VVVVNVDNSDLKLKPGMTANVSIEVAKKDDVLKLPPAALRFKPKAKADEAKAKSGAERNGTGMQRPATSGGGKPGGRKASSGQQVYILKDNQPVAVPVKTGIANNSSIELVESTLKEGDEVVVEQSGGESKKKSGGSPMGRPF
jgi:HlyD family secretion protein